LYIGRTPDHALRGAPPNWLNTMKRMKYGLGSVVGMTHAVQYLEGAFVWVAIGVLAVA
jgi:hypothetical protein